MFGLLLNFPQTEGRLVANGSINLKLQRVFSYSNQGSSRSRSFQQREGFDYSETLAPVSSTICVSLSLAAMQDLYLHNMHVKTAF